MSLSLFNTCPISNNFTPFTPFTAFQPVIMPLVTPKSTGDRTEEWTNKLVGKNIHEEEAESTATVGRPLPDPPDETKC
jgi:hypothetical protein